MKKSFSVYVIVWLIAFCVFSAISFITQAEVLGSKGFETSFWIGYGFILISFVGVLVCAYLAFKSSIENKELVSMFYKFPLISLSYWGLIAMAIVGSVVMAVPAIPDWIGVIVCLVVLAITAIEVIKAYTAADYVANIDNKVAAATEFVRTMTVRAESVADMAKSEAVKNACKKVTEAIRYSDPMSNQGLADSESRISLVFEQLSDAVSRGDDERALETAENLQALVNERNRLCKLMK
ncbi:MAG: hypothetical protein IKX54_04205 [Lachnospiraceae bacterium]|nr:hypothetical protein [Lachnospiraceae bacterium]